MVGSLVGQTLAGRYEVIETIGDGGMGVIYKAIQQPIGREVAIKVLLPEVATHARTIRRFLNEARIIAQLRHPNTVKLYDFGQTEDGRLYMVMEHLDGGTLSAFMEGRRVPQTTALRVIRQICQSLAEAHAFGIIHRDLKPDNILLDRVQGEDLVVRVLDFGVAKVSEEDHANLTPTGSGLGEAVKTLPGTRLGSPSYMSPEQAFAKPVDARADLYSVGVILYRMLTGHLPFESDTTHGLALAHLHDSARAPEEMAPGLSLDPDVSALVNGLLAKRPSDRPNDADTVVRRTERILARLAPPSDQTAIMPALHVLPKTITAQPRPAPTLHDDDWRGAQQRPWLPALTFATGLALGVLAGLLL